METREQAIQRLRELVLEGINSLPMGVADKEYFDQLRESVRRDEWEQHYQSPVPDSIGDPLGSPPAISNDQLGDGDEKR